MKHLLISLLLLSTLTSVACAKSHRDVVENAKKFTVLVTNEGLLGGGRGSGVLLDSTHVLTCAHMSDGMRDQFFVYTYPLGSVIKARAEAVDGADDLMILVLESSATVHVKPVFQDRYTDGERVTILGNSLGSMSWLVSSGVISGKERNFLLTDANVYHGNSGGPWINDAGEIIALSDWGIHNTLDPEIAGGVSAASIKNFFKAIERQKQMSAMLERVFGS